MLHSILICPDREIADHLEAAVTATGEVAISRRLEQYPNAIDLVRTLRAHAPEVVFLSFESSDKAQEVVKYLEKEAEGVQIVAIHRRMDANLLRETMRIGVREFLAEPFERDAIVEMLAAVKKMIERNPPAIESTNQIFAFLPSKAGVGTTTIALNVSAALAQRPNMHVILSDFDLNSGMLRFMLKLQNEHSVIDAVEHAQHVDENLWPQLVTSIKNMDVLHAGRVNPSLRIEAAQVRALIDFMRRNYQALVFDLSGNLERYSLEIMQDCKRVLLVCTPEIPSLHLAREKMQYLRNFDLDGRVSMILNRCQKKAVFTQQQVEELLGVPVLKTFPNDYHGVNEALTAGTCFAPTSEMGKSFAQFAQQLVEKNIAVRSEGKKKFLEIFSIPTRSLASERKRQISTRALLPIVLFRYVGSMDAVFQWIATYGYGAIFLLLTLGVVGLPIPDETLLVFCGYLIYKGEMHPLAAGLSALAGSWCGISISYTVGRTLGAGAVHRYGKYLHITEERLDRVHQWFDRIGHWALFAGYFIVGVRHFTALVAGMSKLRFRSFVAYAWPGGLLWVTIFLTLGYYLGENWKAIGDTIEHYIVYISIVIVAAALCYFLIRKKAKNGNRS